MNEAISGKLMASFVFHCWPWGHAGFDTRMVRLSAAHVKLEAVIMESEDERFPEDEFLVPGNLWFITGKPTPPDDINAVVSSLVQVEISGGAKHPIVFTDQDSANIFVEKMANVRSDKPVGRAFTLPTPHDLEVFLGVLSQWGVKALGFDPFRDNVRIFPIERILDGLRNRPR
jgi:hypothetical protein